MDPFITFLVFLANFLFFLWFGNRLNLINRHLKQIADRSETQTKLLAAIANSASPIS